MSRIDELLKEMCPEGVEYKLIKSIADVSIGEFIHKNNQSDEALYPVYNGGVSHTGFYEKYNRTENKIIVSARGANAGFVNRVYTKYWSGNSCYTIDIKDKTVNWLYVYYYLKNNELKLVGAQQNGGIPAVSKRQVEEFEVPVPPIEIQQEIVRILDKFTELEAELQAELDSRKKQYEYYREELLAQGIPVMLSDVAAYVKERVDAIEINASNYVGVDNILQNRAGKKDSEHYPTEGKTGAYKENDVLIGNIRPYLKKIWFANCNGGTNGDVLVIRSLDEEKLLPEYLYHVLSSDRFFDYDTSFSKGGKMPRGDKEAIMKYQMMLPSVCEQRKIVDTLNRFKELCSDVENGLPAEIEAHHKQYEYYRDKLLTFERKVV